MTIKRYNSEKDNTIANSFRENLSARSTKANMGASDILELFSIYGQASSTSVEQTRLLLQFPMDEIQADRSTDVIPQSGSVNFKIKLSNCPHGQTTPENFQVSVHPVLRPWDEGDGLDMESYLDLEGSNWLSSSANTLWHTEGCDYASSALITSSIIPLEYNQFLVEGTENIEIDITGLAEEWIKYQADAGVQAQGGVRFVAQPNADDVLTISSHEGETVTFTFVAGDSSVVGQAVNVKIEDTKANTSLALKAAIETNFNNAIIVTRDAATETLTLKQSIAGLHGNTIITFSGPDSRLAVNSFINGAGMPNYGVVLKLDNSYEDGSRSASYYTKKFYSRSSHEFFLKPQIEAQYDRVIKDDRNHIMISSSVAHAEQNLNRLYYYNYIGGELVDIPTGSHEIVTSFYATADLGSEYSSAKELQTGVGGVSATAAMFVTASKVSTGIYEAPFSVLAEKVPAGTFLNDVWALTLNKLDSTFATGSGFTVYAASSNSYRDIADYTLSITNLKDTYHKKEKATFRVYTRNKNWQPNIYTKATQTAPVNNIKKLFYKITKVSDNYEVISYSTGSTPSYSSVSYDSQGSFFNLDMELLEPNNAYEISFVSKEASNYVEQQEKFRFRVDP